MTDAALDRLAGRVADLLAPRITAALLDALDREQGRRGLVDVDTVARALAVSADYVRDHADELGAIRLGNGPRARLRFDLDQALELVATRDLPKPEPIAPRRRRHLDPATILQVRDAA